MELDRDLASIQEARDLVKKAKAAQAVLADMDQKQVDRIVEKMALAAEGAARKLAQMAVADTGFGKEEDKVTKNLFAARTVYQFIKDQKTIGVIREDKEKKMLEVAIPVGVVAGLVPSTNPTSTTIFKALISVKAGNALVVSPHPSALNCIGETVRILNSAAVEAGGPDGLVTMMTLPTLGGTAELMKRSNMIIATGGSAMVKAAYSSGTPALGVGPGNVPAYIERTADIPNAVRRIIASKTFDNGTICASEQSIVTEACIADKVKQCVIAHGGFFLEGENLAKVKAIMERGNGSMNPAIVGRDAQTIARLAGITIPEGTKLLISDEKGVGKKFPFSKEKLTALLGFYIVENWEEACELCKALLHNCGIGHTLSIHSKNEAVIREFGLKKPVSRIVVNSPSTHGGVGLTTALFPSFTLGCGAVGGSATSDNITPMNLLNIRRVAYYIGESRIRQLGADEAPAASGSSCCAQGKPNINIDALTSLIVAELKKMM